MFESQNSLGSYEKSASGGSLGSVTLMIVVVLSRPHSLAAI